MKRLAVLSILLVAGFAPAAVAAEACKSEKAVIKVSGMVCDFCAQSIIKYMEQKQGFKDVTIDLTAETVTVPYTISEKPDDARLISVIDYAGYDVTAIERSCL